MQIFRDLLCIFFLVSHYAPKMANPKLFSGNTFRNDQAKNSSLHVQNAVIYVHSAL